MEQVSADDLRSLAARVFALHAGLIAVIETHPRPQAVAAAVTAAEEAGLSNMLYVWQDDHVQTYRRCVQQLRERIPAR